MKRFYRKLEKKSGPMSNNVEYNNPPIGMDGKFITPFIMVITSEDEELTIETDDPEEAEYMVELYENPEFLAYVMKKFHARVRKKNLGIVEDK